MKNLTTQSTRDVLTCCMSLVPGATFSEVGYSHDVRVTLGSTTLRAWWWVGDSEENWAYEISVDGTVRDSGALEDVETLTIYLYEAFGNIVLPAMLVAVLAADAKPVRAHRIMDVAREIVARPKTDAWLSPGSRDAVLNELLLAACEARSLHIATNLLLDAVAMVAPLTGRGWSRPVITGDEHSAGESR